MTYVSPPNTSYLQSMQARHAYQAAEQDTVNALSPAAALAEIKILAAAAHAEYPQYAGHWDGPEWVLVKIVKDMRTKSGQVFLAGDYAIVRRFADDPYRERHAEAGLTSDTAYSVRLRLDCSIRANRFKEIQI